MKNNAISIYKLGMTPLVLFVSFLALLFISFSYANYNDSLTRELEKNATDDLTSSTILAKNTLNRTISNIYDDMYNLVNNYKENNNDTTFSKFDEYVSKYSNLGTYGELSYIPINILKEDYKDKASKTEYKTFIENILRRKEQLYVPSDEHVLIQLAVPVVEESKVLGCIMSSYDKTHISDTFIETTFDGEGTAMLVTYSNGMIKPCIPDKINVSELFSKVDFYSGYSLQKLYQLIGSKSSGLVHYKFEGKSYYTYITPNGNTNVFIINIIPSEHLEQRTHYYIDSAVNMMIRILSCFICLFAFILLSQLYNNRRFKKNHDLLVVQQERFNTILKHSQGALWEYNILTETLIKTDPDLGIYSGLFTIPNTGTYMLENNLIHPDDVELFIEFYNKVKSGAPEISAELRGKAIGGKYVWYELIGTTICDHKGKPITVIGQTNNINDKMIRLHELTESAKRDPLTQLYNRRCGEELINRVIACSSHEGEYHALFMIDVDNFKGINDTYGHTFGDAVLLELSTKMQKTFQADDIICRFGGDEFIAFLTHIPTEEYVKSLAAKISSVFAGIVTDDETLGKITGSIGISLFPKDGTTYKELFQKADMALYYSKSMGKNCYSFYNPELMSSMDYLPSTKDDMLEQYLHTGSKTLINSSILSNTLEILCDAKQLSISINLVLNLIGNYYELDYLCIYELSEDKQFLQITFDWASEQSMKLSNFLPQIPIEVAHDLQFYRNSSVGIFYHNDASSLPYKESEYTDIIKKVHTRSIFQYGIREYGDNHDFIEAVRNNPSRTWTKVELDTLSMLAKVISSYLIKLRTEETANELAKKDLLTRSNNLFSFIDEATKLIQKYPHQQYVLVYTDINNFKSINESYGYSEGNHILCILAENLASMLTEKETYGRISADKFIALLVYQNEEMLSVRLSELNTAMNSIQKTLSDNYKISLIMGLYLIRDDDIDISACIDRANIARKTITDRHKTKYVYFDESMKSRLSKQKEVEDIMEDALKNHEFVVFYQPKFRLDTNQICGAEALVRWQRNDGTMITPNNFIPIFEDNGFIVELDFYVLEQVCKKIRSLLDKNKRVVPISVNFSRMHLRDRMLVPKLTTVVKEYNIPPELIEVEITESALVDDNDYLLTILQDIHKNGFKLSMDDFGSGLSSLNLLRELPFDVLKLDKDFFQKGTTTPRERIIIEYIVKMGLELNMEIISEGVETKEQADFLRSIKCPVAQGYLYERPLPEKQFTEKYCND